MDSPSIRAANPLIPVGSNLILTADEKEYYNVLPKIVFDYIERLFIQGIAKTPEQIRKFVQSELQVNLSLNLIGYILNSNAISLLERRTNYLREKEDEQIAQSISLRNKPISQRHLSLLSRLEVLTNLKIDYFFTNEVSSMPLDDLEQIVSIVSKLIKTYGLVPGLEHANVAAAKSGDTLNDKVADAKNIIITQIVNRFNDQTGKENLDNYLEGTRKILAETSDQKWTEE